MTTGEELLKQFRRSIVLNIKLQTRMKAIETRLRALESVPKTDVKALEKKMDDVILAMKVKR